MKEHTATRIGIEAKTGHEPPGDFKLQRRDHSSWRAPTLRELHEDGRRDGVRQVRHQFPFAPIARFAFESLAIVDIRAGWYHDNPASGHVLAKLGARHNGSRMRDCRARRCKVLCHEMLLTQAHFLRKQAA